MVGATLLIEVGWLVFWWWWFLKTFWGGGGCTLNPVQLWVTGPVGRSFELVSFIPPTKWNEMCVKFHNKQEISARHYMNCWNPTSNSPQSASKKVGTCSARCFQLHPVNIALDSRWFQLHPAKRQNIKTLDSGSSRYSNHIKYFTCTSQLKSLIRKSPELSRSPRSS